MKPDDPRGALAGSGELVCVVCPTGCRISVVAKSGGFTFRGVGCARGREYAECEIAEPMRTFTGTVRVRGGARPVVPVRTDGPVPREALRDVARIAARLEVSAPVAAGAVLASGLPGGRALVSTAGVPCRSLDTTRPVS